jgi:hypothetical protein
MHRLLRLCLVGPMVFVVTSVAVAQDDSMRALRPRRLTNSPGSRRPGISTRFTIAFTPMRKRWCPAGRRLGGLSTCSRCEVLAFPPSRVWSSDHGLGR